MATRTITMTLAASLSRNYNVFKAELIETPIEYDDAIEGDMEAKIRQKYALLRRLVDEQHGIVGGVKR